ncbi:elongation factor G [Desulfovibrio sp. OttesenSCG-928-C06]|nr:elongation factor G [Desulfovibrio sp. OttesenSCG-928-C06]
MSKQTAYLKKLRNIGIIAHIDAGKTTLSERILFYTRKIHRMGEVHEGAATMDFMPEEQERGITIVSAVTTCEWDGHVINLIDTPGHVDFSIEVERSLRVLDGAVGVFCAVGGVEPQSETVWRQAEKFGVPRLAFINKMDRLGASFSAVLDDMREKLGVRPVPLVVPLGEGEEFEALIDVLGMERIDFDPASLGREFTRRPLDDEEAALAAPWRESLLDALGDLSDEVMEKYLAGEELPADLLHATVRKGVLSRAFVPVYSGSALKNCGVQMLLDGICAYLPDPSEAVPQEAEELKSRKSDGESGLLLETDPDGPLAALVFKIYMEAGRKLSLVRVYSGRLREGMACLNSTRNQLEKIGRIFRLDVDDREQITEALAGDIVALQGVRSASTGDTLSLPDQPFLLENIASYRPVISIAIEPRNSAEGEKMDEILGRFMLEDPTVQVEMDDDSGQRIVSGMGELHLEILLERMKREHALEPRAGNPQVVCQETVSGTAEACGEFDRELGDIRHYGQVCLRVSACERGSGNRVVWAFDVEDKGAAKPQPWPRAWIESVEQGIDDTLQSGVIQGFPVQDVQVEVVSMQRNDCSSQAGYHMAAVSALKSALAAARPVLLEPIMYLEISVPDSHLGAALNLLSSHSGRVSDMQERGDLKVVKALAPMRELFGFSTYLRSSTQGRAGLIMRFEHFDAI